MFKYYFSQRGERLAHRDEQVSQCVTFPEAQLSVSLPVSSVSVSDFVDVCHRLPPACFEVSCPSSSRGGSAAQRGLVFCSEPGVCGSPAGAAFAFIQMKIFSNFHCDVIFDLFNSQIFGHFPFSVFYLTRCDHSDFSGPKLRSASAPGRHP